MVNGNLPDFCSSFKFGNKKKITYTLNLKKNRVDQVFTGENKKNKTKKKQVEFFTFFEVYVFFNGSFPGLWVIFLVLLSHIQKI